MAIHQVDRTKTKYLVGVLEELNRRTSDEFGNPQYEAVIRLEDGTEWKGITARSAGFAGFAYGIGNCFGKRVQISDRGVKTISGCSRII